MSAKASFYAGLSKAVGKQSRDERRIAKRLGAEAQGLGWNSQG